MSFLTAGQRPAPVSGIIARDNAGDVLTPPNIGVIPPVSQPAPPAKPEIGGNPPPPPAPAAAGDVPNPSNSYNQLAAAAAAATRAKGRLSTIFTSNYGLAPRPNLSLSRQILTGV